jgi:hypothetical protein
LPLVTLSNFFFQIFNLVFVNAHKIVVGSAPVETINGQRQRWIC